MGVWNWQKVNQNMLEFYIKANIDSFTATTFPSSPILHDNRNIKQKFLIAKISHDFDYIKENLDKKNNQIYLFCKTS
jgi:hypothetical protein